MPKLPVIVNGEDAFASAAAPACASAGPATAARAANPGRRMAQSSLITSDSPVVRGRLAAYALHVACRTGKTVAVERLGVTFCAGGACVVRRGAPTPGSV